MWSPYFPQATPRETAEIGWSHHIAKNDEVGSKRGEEGITERDDGGKQGVIMGDQVHISRMVGRFSSHTQMHSNPRGGTSSGDKEALRERLIAAALEVLADGSDPCLTESRALA